MLKISIFSEDYYLARLIGCLIGIDAKGGLKEGRSMRMMRSMRRRRMRMRRMKRIRRMRRMKRTRRCHLYPLPLDDYGQRMRD